MKYLELILLGFLINSANHGCNAMYYNGFCNPEQIDKKFDVVLSQEYNSAHDNINTNKNDMFYVNDIKNNVCKTVFNFNAEQNNKNTVLCNSTDENMNKFINTSENKSSNLIKFQQIQISITNPQLELSDLEKSSNNNSHGNFTRNNSRKSTGTSPLQTENKTNDDTSCNDKKNCNLISKETKQVGINKDIQNIIKETQVMKIGETFYSTENLEIQSDSLYNEMHGSCRTQQGIQNNSSLASKYIHESIFSTEADFLNRLLNNNGSKIALAQTYKKFLLRCMKSGDINTVLIYYQNYQEKMDKLHKYMLADINEYTVKYLQEFTKKFSYLNRSSGNNFNEEIVRPESVMEYAKILFPYAYYNNEYDKLNRHIQEYKIVMFIKNVLGNKLKSDVIDKLTKTISVLKNLLKTFLNETFQKCKNAYINNCTGSIAEELKKCTSYYNINYDKDKLYIGIYKNAQTIIDFLNRWKISSSMQDNLIQDMMSKDTCVKWSNMNTAIGSHMWNCAENYLYYMIVDCNNWHELYNKYKVLYHTI